MHPIVTAINRQLQTLDAMLVEVNDVAADVKVWITAQEGRVYNQPFVPYTGELKIRQTQLLRAMEELAKARDGLSAIVRLGRAGQERHRLSVGDVRLQTQFALHRRMNYYVHELDALNRQIADVALAVTRSIEAFSQTLLPTTTRDVTS